MTEIMAPIKSEIAKIDVEAKLIRFRGLAVGEFGWIWLATLALFAVSAIVAPGTVRLSSLLSIAPFAAILAIVAVGQTLVIQQRGLDMSLVALVALGGVLAAKLAPAFDSVLAAVLVTMAIAAALGVFNGFLIARLGIMPLVATLASNAIFLGLVRMISGDRVNAAPSGLSEFSQAQILGVPNTILLSLAFIVAVTLTLKFTRVGRYFVIVGAAPDAARAAGINVLGFQIGAYAFASTCFAAAGMLLAGLIGSASNLAGPEYLLPSIAAVVVGGASFGGGRGSVIASGVAAVFMTQLEQMALALGANAAAQLAVQALAIVIAVSLRNLAMFVSIARRAPSVRE
jgi:ribose transport system permease protein